MRIGFDVTGDEEQEMEVGQADSYPKDSWTDKLPEQFFDTFISFWIVYGMFASIRDLLLSLF